MPCALLCGVLEKHCCGQCHRRNSETPPQHSHSQLNNAAKFTERGSIVFEVDRVSEPTDGVRFRITDTGIGIAPEKQQLVFDLFTQADNDSSRVFQGTGIGLSIGRRRAVVTTGF